MKMFFLFSLLALTVSAFGQHVDTIDLKSFFGAHTGGFSVYSFRTNRYLQYNVDQCKKRFSPCSTFKIPNSLIALETGVVPNSGFIIKYDSVLHPRDTGMVHSAPFQDWFQDLSLKQAFQYSCVWYYQELARRIGHERMSKYVDLLEYGSMDISSGDDTFWLCGSLQISIDEQIEFLKKLYLRQLKGFSDTAMNTVKGIMLYESVPRYRLYGKTGTGDCMNGKYLAWYVGFVETDSDTSVFAMNIIVNKFDDLKNNFRIELTKNILRKLEIIRS
jgi:beta-lactamase class D